MASLTDWARSINRTGRRGLILFAQSVRDAIVHNTHPRQHPPRGLAEFSRGLAEFSRGLADLSRGLAEFSRGLAEFSRGLAEFIRGLAEFSRGLTELSRGLAEVSRGLADCSRVLAEFSTFPGIHRNHPPPGPACFDNGVAVAGPGCGVGALLLGQRLEGAVLLGVVAAADEGDHVGGAPDGGDGHVHLVAHHLDGVEPPLEVRHAERGHRALGVANQNPTVSEVSHRRVEAVEHPEAVVAVAQ
eukprot:1182952-Prorocentrum_minimum.AAC.1